jgi:ABC-type branched-subunit amino acid transport system substrate-binding protein
MAKYDSREVPDFYMPFSYDAVLALVYAANAAVKNNVTMWSDGPELLEALKTIKYTGLTGEVSFTESLFDGLSTSSAIPNRILVGKAHR